MEALAALWIPILLSAGLIFVASSIAWMALPHHRADRARPVPDPQVKMSTRLTLWFLNQVFITALTAYLLYYALPPEAPYMLVFRVGGTALFLGEAGVLFARSIFWGWPWRGTIVEAIEGLVYAMLGAGVFGWWWIH